MENKTPFNLEAEQALLGTMLIDNSIIDEITDIVKNEHFYEPIHQYLFSAILHITGQGKVADGITLHSQLATTGLLKDIGGANYIAILMDMCADSVAAIDYAKFILEQYQRREALRITSAFNSLILSDTERPIDALMAEFEGELQSLNSIGSNNAQFKAGDAALQFAKDLRNGQGDGVFLGLSELNDTIGRVGVGNLCLVGGRPAMGKSAVALTVAQNIAMTGKGVLFFSMDMAADQVSTRLLSMFCKDRIEYRDITAAKVNDSMQAQLNEAAFALQSLPLEIDDKRGRTVADILAATRRAKAAFEAKGIELGLVIVDHLQKIKAHNQNANDYSRATDNIRSLKDAAMKMGAPVMLCSQLSRGLESRDDKRPRMSDLRDSGAIEEEADVITLLYRDAYYARQMMDAETDGAEWEKLESRFNATRNDLDLISPKVRQGEPKSVKVNIDIGVNRIAVRPRHDRFGVVY